MLETISYIIQLTLHLLQYRQYQLLSNFRLKKLFSKRHEVTLDDIASRF